MIRLTTVVILAFFSQSIVLADDNSELTAQLLERIKNLENRVEELEAIAKKVPREVQPQKHAVPPSTYPKPSTSPNHRFLPPSTTVPSNGIPKSWQSFEFNGQTVYIILCKGAQRQDGAAVARYPMPNNSDGVQLPKSNRVYSNPK